MAVYQPTKLNIYFLEGIEGWPWCSGSISVIFLFDLFIYRKSATAVWCTWPTLWLLFNVQVYIYIYCLLNEFTIKEEDPLVNFAWQQETVWKRAMYCPSHGLFNGKVTQHDDEPSNLGYAVFWDTFTERYCLETPRAWHITLVDSSLIFWWCFQIFKNHYRDSPVVSNM